MTKLPRAKSLALSCSPPDFQPQHLPAAALAGLGQQWVGPAASPEQEAKRREAERQTAAATGHRVRADCKSR